MTPHVDRRTFLVSSGAFVTLAAFGMKAGERPSVRFGFITDCHYAPHIVPKAGDRRVLADSLEKLRTFVREMNDEGVDFVVEGGDFKDLGRTPAESLAYLDAMEGAFAAFKGPRYHVLGNHDHDNLTKEEFLSHVANAGQDKAKAYYAFTCGGIRFIVLDACYSPDGTPYCRGKFSWKKCFVPPEQVAFLKAELAAAEGPCVPFLHQQLDPEDETCIANAAEIRAILEASGKVKGVIQGHYHEGSFRELGGIGYYSAKASAVGAAPEAGAACLVEVYPSGGMRILGRRAAESVANIPGPGWEGDTAWRKGHYQVHYIYTGRSESMFHVFPDGTTMLLDCGDTMRFYGTPQAVPVPDLSCRAGEFAARYVRRVSPKDDRVDILHLSHYHSDHAGCYAYHGGLLPDGRPLAGLSDAARFLRFGRVVDRAAEAFDDPVDLFALNAPGETVKHLKLLYRHLADTQGTTVEKFALGSRAQFRQQNAADAAPDFGVFNLCANGRFVRPDGSIADLYASQVAEVRAGTRKVLNENGMSCGFIVSYGKFRYYTAGDFSAPISGADKRRLEIENLLGEAVGPVDVAKLNHHGHHSMYPNLVRALKARVWTNCSLDQLHCTDDTMTRLADRTLYAGERLLLPTYQPHDRKVEGPRDYLRDVPTCVYDSPCHVILDVMPGGDAYTLFCRDAMKPGNPLKAEFSYYARG